MVLIASFNDKYSTQTTCDVLNVRPFAHDLLGNTVFRVPPTGTRDPSYCGYPRPPREYQGLLGLECQFPLVLNVKDAYDV